MRVRRTGATSPVSGIAAAAGVVTALALTLSACGGGGGGNASLADKAKNEKQLTIGIKFDQPGIGLRKPDGSFSGFDVDVANYIAKKLGATKVTFKEARSANRETFIEQGQVDLVIASYSITEERKQKVLFAGPYYIAHQDILVRQDETGINGPQDMNGRRLCSVQGSISAINLQKKFAPKAKLQQESGYANCVERLLAGQVDAVSTDDTILAGFAAQHPGKLKIVGHPFTDEKYGIGLKKGDKKGCEAVNNAVTAMYQDGSAKQILEKNFGPAGYKYSTQQPPFEGCG